GEKGCDHDRQGTCLPEGLDGGIVVPISEPSHGGLFGVVEYLGAAVGGQMFLIYAQGSLVIGGALDQGVPFVDELVEFADGVPEFGDGATGDHRPALQQVCAPMNIVGGSIHPLPRRPAWSPGRRRRLPPRRPHACGSNVPPSATSATDARLARQI